MDFLHEGRDNDDLTKTKREDLKQLIQNTMQKTTIGGNSIYTKFLTLPEPPRFIDN